MNITSKALIVETLMEALWGKRFQIIAHEKNGKIRRYIGIATANSKPGERPYRITWFWDKDPVGHVDMTWAEINNTLATKQFSPSILRRAEQMWGPDKIALSYIIKLYPDNNMINEGISIGVVGFNYNEQIKDMSDLSLWLREKVLTPILKKIPDEEKKPKTADLITPDGTSDVDTTGVMNVYVGEIPKEWHPKLLGGIAYFLKKLNIETGDWTTDISKMFNTETVRIPIKSVNPAKDAAPTVDMSYGTLQKILDLIDLKECFNDYTASIPVDQLLDKIDAFQYSDDYMKTEPETPSAVLHFMNALFNVAQWAKKHGYTHIGGA